MAAKVSSRDINTLIWIICLFLTYGKIGFSNGVENETLLIPCKEGWFYFEEKCYTIGNQGEAANWERASNYCAEQGGNIVTIHSSKLQNFLVAFLLLDVKSSVWIGLHDRENESQFTWEDGSTLDYKNWEYGHPNNNEWEDCVQMRYLSTDAIGKWKVLPCEWEYPFICQSDKDEKEQNLDIFCSSEKGGGFKYLDSCYHYVKRGKPWEDAEEYCNERYGGHLVTILDAATETFLSYIYKDKWYWIGINTDEKEKWSSGWQVFREFWYRHYGPGTGYCVYHVIESNSNSYWKTFPCYRNLPFICQVSKNQPPVEESWQCPDTSDKWKRANGKLCYLLETDQKLSWADANQACSSKGGSLVSIHSKEETFLLYSFMKDNNFGMLIGLRRSSSNDSEFEWADGSEMQYQNWFHGKPHNKLKKCGELTPWYAKWNEVDCNIRKNYICSAKKVPPKETNTMGPGTEDLTTPPTETEKMDSGLNKNDQEIPRNLSQINESIVKTCCCKCTMTTETIAGL